jgi:hypothetical protein
MLRDFIRGFVQRESTKHTIYKEYPPPLSPRAKPPGAAKATRVGRTAKVLRERPRPRSATGHGVLPEQKTLNAASSRRRPGSTSNRRKRKSQLTPEHTIKGCNKEPDTPYILDCIKYTIQKPPKTIPQPTPADATAVLRPGTSAPKAFCQVAKGEWHRKKRTPLKPFLSERSIKGYNLKLYTQNEEGRGSHLPRQG